MMSSDVDLLLVMVNYVYWSWITSSDGELVMSSDGELRLVMVNYI